MKIKGIIFDFDGTLFDSMVLWETAGSRYIQSLGLSPEEELDQVVKTMSLYQAAEYLNEQYHLTATIEETMEGVNRLVEADYFYHVLPKEGVVSALKKFQEQNISMCIATATDRYQIEAALKRCEMDTFFSEILTCSEVGAGKDEPLIYEEACKALGVPKEETAVFEDAYHAAKTAKDAGFYVVGVYDSFNEKKEELKLLADQYINHFHEFVNQEEQV